MPTDISDNLEEACADSAGPMRGRERGRESGHGEASVAAPLPVHSLKFRGTLFGSTLARVFTAVDHVAPGEVVSITTNDP